MQLSRMICCCLLGSAIAFTTACNRGESPKPAAPTASTSSSASEPATAAASSAADTVSPPAPVQIKGPDEPKVEWGPLLDQLGPPSLVVLQQANGRCEWSVLRPPQLEERLFLISQVCPTGFVWDRRGGRSLFRLEAALYLHDWQQGTVRELAPPPLGAPNFGFSATGAIRACEDSIQADGNGNTVGYRMTLQRQENGEWNKIAFENTGYHILEPGCLDSSHEQDFGELSYSPRFQSGISCDDETQPARPNCPDKALVADLKTRIEREHDGIEFIAFANRSFIAFPVGFGMEDSTKLAPIFSIENDTITEIYDRPSEQLEWAVLPSADHLLVRAINLKNATLFQKGQTEPLKVFADDAEVFWIPGTIAPTDVINLTPEKKSGDKD